MEVDRVVYAPDGRPAARLEGVLEEAARYAVANSLSRVAWLLPGACRFDLCSAAGDEIQALAPSFALRRETRRPRAAPQLKCETFAFADEASLAAYRAWKDAA